MKKIFLALCLLLSACAKSEDAGPSSPPPDAGFHKIMNGISGGAIYIVVSFPTVDTMRFQKYYLTPTMTPGTYSIDNAKVEKNGTTWNLTFENSDCAQSGAKLSIIVGQNSNTYFSYTIDGAPTKSLSLETTQYEISKLAQYKIDRYTRGTYCD